MLKDSAETTTKPSKCYRGFSQRFYHLLRDGGEYRDLGKNYFDELKEAKVVRRLERRLQALGYDVTLEKKAA